MCLLGAYKTFDECWPGLLQTWYYSLYLLSGDRKTMIHRFMFNFLFCVPAGLVHALMPLIGIWFPSFSAYLVLFNTCWSWRAERLEFWAFCFPWFFTPSKLFGFFSFFKILHRCGGTIVAAETNFTFSHWTTKYLTGAPAAVTYGGAWHFQNCVRIKTRCLIGFLNILWRKLLANVLGHMTVWGRWLGRSKGLLFICFDSGLFF